MKAEVLSCPACGGFLKDDLNSGIAKCEFCGNYVFLNELEDIQKLKLLRKFNNIDNFLELAFIGISEKNFKYASNYLELALQNNSKNPKAWYGKALILLYNNPDNDNYNSILKYLKYALKNSDESFKQKVKNEISHIIKNIDFEKDCENFLIQINEMFDYNSKELIIKLVDTAINQYMNYIIYPELHSDNETYKNTLTNAFLKLKSISIEDFKIYYEIYCAKYDDAVISKKSRVEEKMVDFEKAYHSKHFIPIMMLIIVICFAFLFLDKKGFLSIIIFFLCVLLYLYDANHYFNKNERIFEVRDIPQKELF